MMKPSVLTALFSFHSECVEGFKVLLKHTQHLSSSAYKLAMEICKIGFLCNRYEVGALKKRAAVSALLYTDLQFMTYA